MKISLAVGPGAEPVTLAEAKAHLKVDADQVAEDGLITRCITAARMYCETIADRCFIATQFLGRLDEFPTGDIVVPENPIRSVESITYTDSAGATQTLASTEYQVDLAADPGRIAPGPGKSWPATQSGRLNAVTVAFTSGMSANAAGLDPRCAQAVLLLVGHWFENREAVLTGTISKEIEHAVAGLMGQLWNGQMD